MPERGVHRGRRWRCEQADRGIPLPPGYRFQQDGDNQVMRDLFGYAIVALVLAVTFIYFSARFAMSFAQPLAIMATLPMSLIGVMLALLLTNHVQYVRHDRLHHADGAGGENGILLVDFANQARAGRGQIDHRGAGGGGSHPSAPILMTTAAMVFGMLPMAAALQGGADGTMGRRSSAAC